MHAGSQVAWALWLGVKCIRCEQPVPWLINLSIGVHVNRLVQTMTVARGNSSRPHCDDLGAWARACNSIRCKPRHSAPAGALTALGTPRQTVWPPVAPAPPPSACRTALPRGNPRNTPVVASLESAPSARPLIRSNCAYLRCKNQGVVTCQCTEQRWLADCYVLPSMTRRAQHGLDECGRLQQRTAL